MNEPTKTDTAVWHLVTSCFRLQGEVHSDTARYHVDQAVRHLEKAAENERKKVDGE